MRALSRVLQLKGVMPIAALCLCACTTGGEPSKESDARFSFPPPTAEEINSVTAAWAQRDLTPNDVELVTSDTSSADYDVDIFKHRVGGKAHFGAVSIPKNAQPGAIPVVLHADGLSQQDPHMDLDKNLAMAGTLLKSVVYVVPVFRGRTLIYKGASYSAEGDACDAYDGAADDAIALLNVVEQEVIAANLDRVMVRGGDRGGNTALLLAIRDPRIKIALAISAPTDFNRLEVRVRLGDQYKCQFLDKLTAEQSRLRILASSPIYFRILDTVRELFLFHGSVDSVIPLWNAVELADRLNEQGAPVQLKVFEGYGHEDLDSSSEFRAAQRAVFAELFAL
jgi:dipeptidyl aminopeptidase/acylaminoacyl peptidase